MNNYGVIAHLAYFSFRSLGAGSWASGERVLPSAIDVAMCGYECRYGAALNIDLIPQPMVGPAFKNRGQTKRTISWIQPLGGTWQVQQTTDLKKWTTLTTSPSITDDVYSTSVTCSSPATFYRMAGQPASFVTAAASQTNEVRKSVLAPPPALMQIDDGD